MKKKNYLLADGGFIPDFFNNCSYAIEELLSGFDAKFRERKPPQKKSRDQYLDETFMDWNLPEMSDEEYNKLIEQVDGFLRAWEKNI